MSNVALGVDLGGTNLRAAVVDSTGRLLYETSTSTLANEGVDSVIERIANAILEAATACRVDANVPVGVAAPGPLDPRTGVIFFTPNLPGWRDVPLGDRLARLTGRHIVLGNDANAAALGEFYFGSGRDVRNMIYIGLGTGIGGGVIADGRLIDGARGLGGELGHVTVSIDGPRCTCGSIGCIEAYCSAWSITRDAQHLVSSGRGLAIAEAARGQPVGPRAVGAAARLGDPDALRLLERAGTALGAGIANFINIFNPELIVIGGGLSEIGEPLLEPVRRAIATYAMPAIRQDARLVASTLGIKSGIIGSAALVFHENQL
ncbi:MAG TPA: ROK family protein [Thermomicrobiales bacterium]|nr:ROK family protein [Thermomicrobiales bacterium]